MDAIFKRSVKYFWRISGAYRPFASRTNAFVLSFHRVKPLDNSLLDARLGAISPKGLERTLKMVMDLGFKFVTLEEFTQCGKGAPQKSVCLTFDDGLRDIVDFALPVLTGLRIPATVFLITSLVGRQDLLWQHRIYEAIERLSIVECLRLFPKLAPNSAAPIKKAELAGNLIRALNRGELLEASNVLATAARLTREDEIVLSRQLYLKEQEIPFLEKNGIAVEGHGFEHWPAGKLTGDELYADYRTCHDNLSGWLARDRFAFCIPFGDVSNQSVEVAGRAGFANVLASDGVVKSASERFCPRYWPSENLDDFVFQLSRASLQQK